MSGDTKKSNKFLLLYGSQTGQAEAIAKEIHEESSKHGLVSELHCLSKTDKKFKLENERTLVIVVSTTGEGDPPDTALKFWRRIKKRTLSSEHLDCLRYTLLGLGDSNYSNFCHNGKNFDRRLMEIGATQFYPSNFADDAVGLELVVEPWLEGLWPALRKELLGLEETGVDGSKDSEVGDGVPKGAADSNHTATSRGGDSNMEELANGPPPVTDSGDSSQPPITDTGDSSPTPEITDSHSEAAMGPDEVAAVSEPDPAVPSLTISAPPLSTSDLTLPSPPHPFLQLLFHQDQQQPGDYVRPDASYPFSTSPVSMATVVSAQRLTRQDAVKTTLGIELDISGTGLCGYSPGDSFGVVCPNDEAEVEVLLDRLLLVGEQADRVFSLSLLPHTKRKTAAVPGHIPPRCTPRQALLHCLDIRTPPKKALLRWLADHCSAAGERRRMQELCSRQGSALYGQLVLGAGGRSLAELLAAFPSCRPPLTTLLELLPRLQPRPYSVASSPLLKADRAYFAFNVVEREGELGRRGVCTGWIDRITRGLQDNQAPSQPVKIPVFARRSTNFRLPPNPGTTGLVMVGPGTGVAPFIGFLQHLSCQARAFSTPAPPTTWLLFGCRHRDRDFIFRRELEGFLEQGVLSRLDVCYSRHAGSGTPRYVQDGLRQRGAELCRLLMVEKCKFYVCGDAKNMAPDVYRAVLDILVEHGNKTREEALSYVAHMKSEKLYVEDVWT